VKIDRDAIRHLEKLSRIDLAPGEVEQLTEQLNRIVEFVEQLQSVDTTGVAPTRLMAAADEEHLREDQVRAGLERELALGQAPDRTDAFFRVPPVLGKGEE